VKKEKRESFVKRDVRITQWHLSSHSAYPDVRSSIADTLRTLCVIIQYSSCWVSDQFYIILELSSRKPLVAFSGIVSRVCGEILIQSPSLTGLGLRLEELNTAWHSSTKWSHWLLMAEIWGRVVRTFGPWSKDPRGSSPGRTRSVVHQCSSTGLSKTEWCLDCQWFMHLKDTLPLGSFGISLVPGSYSGWSQHWASMLITLKWANTDMTEALLMADHCILSIEDWGRFRNSHKFRML
jgi:hypothetical protein